MINDGINNVPENTIAIIHPTGLDPKNNIDSIISRPSKKREWFTPHFYRCLPLTIGNQYGFIVKTNFDIYFKWDGGENADSIIFGFSDDLQEIDNIWPGVESRFGSGIITLTLPFSLRTPPGINLMTINPPNYIIPNITVMTGVVETDNLRYTFTINLKIQQAGLETLIPKGTPIAALLPIPRYFQDRFNLVEADSIFNKEVVDEERKAIYDQSVQRNTSDSETQSKVNKLYLNGSDVYKNKFKDHQGPNIIVD